MSCALKHRKIRQCQRQRASRYCHGLVGQTRSRSARYRTDNLLKWSTAKCDRHRFRARWRNTLRLLAFHSGQRYRKRSRFSLECYFDNELYRQTAPAKPQRWSKSWNLSLRCPMCDKRLRSGQLTCHILFETRSHGCYRYRPHPRRPYLLQKVCRPNVTRKRCSLLACLGCCQRFGECSAAHICSRQTQTQGLDLRAGRCCLSILDFDSLIGFQNRSIPMLMRLSELRTSSPALCMCVSFVSPAFARRPKPRSP